MNIVPRIIRSYFYILHPYHFVQIKTQKIENKKRDVELYNLNHLKKIKKKESTESEFYVIIMIFPYSSSKV